MSTPLDELIALLRVADGAGDRFVGRSEDLGWGTVYGGQVLGQAVLAASRTVGTERAMHSLHAYFLERGDVAQSVEYAVERIRDGGAFTTRRVVASQAAGPIFNLAASFQRAETGFVHQDEMPAAPPPESLPTELERLAARVATYPPKMRERALRERPFDVRAVESPAEEGTKRPPSRLLWFRAAGPLPDDTALHTALLAYVTDYAFLGTALLPHGVTWLTPGVQAASLDHVMWIHEAPRVDGWHLYAMESPVATGARGLVRGRIFRADGKLVATTAQEGLLRIRRA